MRVFVINQRGEALMPCTQRKARLLLKEGNAKIHKYNPFTIQLTVPTGESKQDCHVGIDTGAKHIGFAITSQNKVLFKGEVELRQDVKGNLDTRRIYRKSRHNRKTRYRKEKFLNRKRGENWLPPSLQNRINHTYRWIDEMCNLVSNPILHIEVGKFDIAKMINTKIQGVDYQYGQTYRFYNVRYFVFARDNYTCQCCGKSKDKILHTHHILYKSQGGTDRADNLITVCSDCHTTENHKPGGVLYNWMIRHKKVKQYKEPPFMNVLRKRIFDKYPTAIISYGSETSMRRKELGLSKTHYNDAIAISGISNIKENPDEGLFIKQFRKKKRSLHEATARKGRKEPNRTQKRNSKNTKEYNGWFLNDVVEVFGKCGFISGFTNSGAYIKDFQDNYIALPNKNYKQINIKELRLKNHENNWRYTIQPNP